MRTALTIDDDVLEAPRSLATRQRRTRDEVISEWSRQALRPADAPAALRNGIALLPKRAGQPPVTLESVNWLRGESI